jgi:hypothetical protein
MKAGLRALGLLASLVVVTTGCAWLSRSRDTGSEGATIVANDDRAETEAALAILERMAAYLTTREAFRFRAEVRYDAVQASGARIEFGSDRTLAARRPDRLRVDVVHWDGGRELLLYDGSQVWAASHGLHADASTEHVGTLDSAIDRLQDEIHLPTPLGELIEASLDSAGQRLGIGRRLSGAIADRQLVFPVDSVRGRVHDRRARRAEGGAGESQRSLRVGPRRSSRRGRDRPTQAARGPNNPCLDC